MKSAIVAVTVATVWTNPDSPLEKDRAALTSPVDIRAWLGSLTVEDKLDFFNRNAIQTQALFGTRVEVVEERDGWSHILIPDQSSNKNETGYPGWVPSVQLAPWSDAYQVAADQQIVTVTSAHARLYTLDQQPGIELAFLTRLPLIAETADWVKVATPLGDSLLRREDVRISQAGQLDSKQPDDTGSTGERIVETAKRFLGLPYLWGGMSSYGYDCSGFAYNMHRAVGITIPRDASDQARAGRLVEKSELLPGDLLFFAYEEGKGRVHHVGIYYGGGQMIHSPDSRGAIEIVDLSTYKLKHEHSVSRRYW